LNFPYLTSIYICMHKLTDYPVVFSLPVQWGDQDALGHVNNIVYLRWCESARLAYLERIGLLEMAKQTRVWCILAHVGCNYRQPVVYPDTVHVGARVTKIGTSSFRMEHAIFSDALGLAAEADSTLVVYDYQSNKPCPMPAEIRAAIESLEQRAVGDSRG
jgi:acyl-CoA thioester hydrolase